jgi:hypothetical protein
MDQPTSLEITIRGKTEEVKRAALAAQRRIDLETVGFDENAYAFGDGSDFKGKLDKTLNWHGSYSLDENADGIAEYSTEQESYGCVEEKDIKEIAEDIIKVSPFVEVHISAVITITCAEGYDLCVDVDCVEGKIKVDVSEEYYDCDEEDEDD